MSIIHKQIVYPLKISKLAKYKVFNQLIIYENNELFSLLIEFKD